MAIGDGTNIKGPIYTIRGNQTYRWIAAEDINNDVWFNPIENQTEHSDYLAGLAAAEDFINGKS